MCIRSDSRLIIKFFLAPPIFKEEKRKLAAPRGSHLVLPLNVLSVFFSTTNIITSHPRKKRQQNYERMFLLKVSFLNFQSSYLNFCREFPPRPLSLIFVIDIRSIPLVPLTHRTSRGDGSQMSASKICSPAFCPSVRHFHRLAHKYNNAVGF